MNRRLELHGKLSGISGIKAVYFQPPENVRIVYPCIVYSLDMIDVKYADDRVYKGTKRYSVTVIDKNPDSVVPDKLLELPFCSFNRAFTANNLNHWVFSVYY